MTTSDPKPGSRSGRDKEPIEITVVRAIREYGLLKEGDPVIVACSGGADSTALLASLVSLGREWEFDLTVAHFNHNLRASAGRDEEHVRRMAGNFGLPCRLGSGDVRSHARKQGLNLEEAARELRYGFLRSEAGRIPGARIAVGHTQDDQAETVLMRLLRGSGPLGLTGIWPRVDDLIVRPLILTRRRAVLSYLREQGLDFRQDESNRDRRYLRNRIRLDLLPLLQKDYSPDIVPRLSRLADILQQEEIWLDELVGQAVSAAVIRKEIGLLLDGDVLTGFPRGLARRVVRRYVEEIRGHLRSLTLEDVGAILDLQEGSRISIKKDLDLRREKGLIFPARPLPESRDYDMGWDGRDPLEVEEAGLRFSGRRINRPEWVEEGIRADDRIRAFLDAGRIGFPLRVRNRRKGDLYRPYGAPGRKKVKEIMRARRIPPEQRGRLPVFMSGGEIVWIPGLPVAESYKVTKDTREVFVISLVKRKR